MTTLVGYADLPEEIRAHLTELEDFISTCDGKECVIQTDDNTCIDDGTIDAEDAVRAFNALVGLIRARPAPAAEGEVERLKGAIQSFIQAEDEVEAEARRAEANGGLGWSSAPTVRRVFAVKGLRKLLSQGGDGERLPAKEERNG